MSWTEHLRQRLAVRLPEATRPMKGHTLQSAEHLALVYTFRDEQRFTEVKRLADAIEQQHGVKVTRFALVDLASKETPHWLHQLPQSRFIAKDEVTLWGQPKGEAHAFCRERWDVLMNVESTLPTPLLHVVRSAQASMKVAVRQPVRNEDYDILFEPISEESLSDRVQRMIRFLSTTQLT